MDLAGFEPAFSACRADILPLDDRPEDVVESWGFEPQSSPCRGGILPLDDDPRWGSSPAAAGQGMEPVIPPPEVVADRCYSYGVVSSRRPHAVQCPRAGPENPLKTG